MMDADDSGELEPEELALEDKYTMVEDEFKKRRGGSKKNRKKK